MKGVTDMSTSSIVNHHQSTFHHLLVKINYLTLLMLPDYLRGIEMATANPDTSNTSDKHNDDNQDKDEENNEAEKSFEVICIKHCCVDD